MSAAMRSRSDSDDGNEDHGHYEDDDDDDDDDDSGEDRKPAAQGGSNNNDPTKKRRRRRVISTLQESKWQQMYQRLLRYKEANGDCLVPNRYAEDTSLGAWVATQRRNYRVFMSGSDEPSGMTAERVQSLEAIGFQWTTTDPRHEPWEVRYEALKGFVNKYGHAEIPMRWEENVQLSNWVSKQRQDYKLRMKGKSSRLTDERMQLLNDIGFKWHIPRKGRKIKQKSIPIIKRNTGQGGAAHSVTSESQGGVPSMGMPSSANGMDYSGHATMHQAAGGPFAMPQPGAAFATLADPPGTSLGMPPVAPAIPGLDLSAFLGAQGTAGAPGLDFGALLGLQNFFQTLTSAGGGAAPILAMAQGASSAPSSQGNPPAPSVSQGNAAAPALQGTNVAAPSNAVVGQNQQLQLFQQQGGQTPTALILPLQMGDFMSSLGGQQIVPVSMQVSSDPANPVSIGVQGIVLNLPAAMAATNQTAAGVPGAGTNPAAANVTQQSIQNMLASQLMNAVAAPQMQQQQLQQPQFNQPQNLAAQLTSLLGLTNPTGGGGTYSTANTNQMQFQIQPPPVQQLQQQHQPQQQQDPPSAPQPWPWHWPQQPPPS